MKYIFKSITVILALICLSFSQIFAQNDGWSKMKLGAGGWLTGMSIHPSGSPVFARSDVNNAWKWNENTQEWSPVITSSSMPPDRVDWHQYMGVLSIASAPSNNQVAYMAFYNTIFKSTNQGNTWVSTNFPGSNNREVATMHPNDDASKLSGERLAVDPANQNVVYFGSINDGLYVTTNGGSSWNSVGAIPSGTAERGVRQVVFDPNSGTSGGRTKTIYVTVDGAGIYRTTNAGASWSNITSGSGFGSGVQFTDMEIANNRHVYVSAIGSGCRRYNGTSWQNVTPPTGAHIMEVAVDPFNNNRVILKAQGNQAFYRTTNASASSPSWTSLSWNTPSSDVPWLAWEGLDWISEGEIMFDPAVQGRLWMVEGIGSWRTTDIQDNNISWTGISKGQEHMVNNDVVALPNGNVVTAVWDRSIFVKNQSNLDEYATRYYPSERFNSTWDLDVSPSNPNFVAAITEDHRYCCYDSGHRRSGYSLDGGLTWTEFGSMPFPNEENSIYGNIAVSANDINNMVWLPSGNRTPHYTTNRGNSWTPINMPGVSDNCCMHAHFLQKEVLVADRVLPNTFYIYDWGNGKIFKSSDGGANWSAQGSVPPWAWHAKLRAVDGKAGHLLFAHGFRSDYASYNQIHGVYISTDGGQTWNEMSNTDKVNNLTTGKAAPGSDYPTIFIQGEVNGDFGYHMSTNRGTSWTKIGTHPFGNFNYAKIMSGDPNTYGRLYVGPDSDGIFYYDISAACPSAGTPCNDGNPNTQNDVEDGNCNCAGTRPSIDICKAVNPPNINGNGNEWLQTNYALNNVLLGTVNSQNDLSANFQIQWDNNYLYIFGNVRDNNLMNDSENAYQDDGIEVYIDGGNEKGTSYDANDHQLLFRVNDNTVHHYSGEQNNPAGVRFAQRTTTAGYAMEIRIAWSFIGVSPADGMPIGIDIHVNDDDNGGNRDKKIAWHATTDQSWNNPSLFNTMTLQSCDTPPPSDCDLITNGDFSDGTTGWNCWNCDINAASGACQITNIPEVQNLWRAALLHSGFVLENGKQYEVSFDARSIQAAKTIQVKVGLGQSPWTGYIHKMFNLSTNNQRHTFLFTMSQPTITNARLEFHVAADLTDLIIDNAQIIDLSDNCNNDCEQVQNGNFTGQFTDDWITQNCQATAANNGIDINIPYLAENPWNIAIKQRGFDYEQGKEYRVTFKAKADAPRAMYVKAGKASTPYTTYGFQQIDNLTTTLQTYDFTFTMNETTDSDAYLEFFLGQSEVNMFLAEVSVAETACAGLRELSNELITNYMIFPNPVSNILTVQFDLSDEYDSGTIRLFDLTGRTILEEEKAMFTNNQFQLNVASIPAGMYMLRLDVGGYFLTHKVVKY